MIDDFGKTSEFKTRLNEALEKRNVRPVELAQITKISESTISQYRSGYAVPKRDKLALISKALNVNPSWLLGMDVPFDLKIYPDPDKLADITLSPIIVEYAWKISKMDETKQKLIFGMIDQMT